MLINIHIQYTILFYALFFKLSVFLKLFQCFGISKSIQGKSNNFYVSINVSYYLIEHIKKDYLK